MKYIFRSILFLILIVPTFTFPAKTLIFVVDVSGSMKKSGIYKSVVDSLIIFIKNEFQEGDNLFLCSFGTSFYTNKILLKGTTEQVKDFLLEIEKLNFVDEWTYMTLAFKEIAELSDDVRKKYPEEPIYIYFYTDGKNEPPPYIKNPLTFEQIIGWYFPSYQNPQANLYIITLGIKPEPVLDNFVNKVGGSIIEVPKPTIDKISLPKPEPLPKPAPLQVEVSPQKISYNTSSKSGKFETKIKFINHYDMEEIKVKMSIDNFRISPEEINLNKGENNITFTVEFKDLSKKINKATLAFSSEISDIKFIPDKVSFEIIKYSRTIWYVLGIAILIFFIFLLKCLTISKFPSLFYLKQLDEQGNVVQQFNLKNRQKPCSNKLKISGDLNIQGIMKGMLELSAKKGSIVYLRVTGKNKAVKFSTGEELTTNEKKLLNPGDEFEFDGVRLKYEKGG